MPANIIFIMIVHNVLVDIFPSVISNSIKGNYLKHEHTTYVCHSYNC